MSSTAARGIAFWNYGQTHKRCPAGRTHGPRCPARPDRLWRKPCRETSAARFRGRFRPDRLGPTTPPPRLRSCISHSPRDIATTDCADRCARTSTIVAQCPSEGTATRAPRDETSVLRDRRRLALAVYTRRSGSHYRLHAKFRTVCARSGNGRAGYVHRT